MQLDLSKVGAEVLRFVVSGTDFLADLLTVVVSLIAIVTFFKNRAKLGVAIRMLLSYSLQLTLGDLRRNLERLNDYNAAEVTHHPEIRNLCHEIVGQIRGNPRLSGSMAATCARIETYARGKRLEEPQKRALTSELRERLRFVQLEEFDGKEGDDE